MPSPRVKDKQALMGKLRAAYARGPYRVPLFLQGFLFIVYMIYL